MIKKTCQSIRRFTELYQRLDLELFQEDASSLLRLTRYGLNSGKLEFYTEQPFNLQKPAQIKACLDNQDLVLNTHIISSTSKSHFYIVELEIQKDSAFKARIFLQLAAIANYKRHADVSGRALSIDQAACEWIDQYAENFATEFDRRINDSPSF